MFLYPLFQIRPPPIANVLRNAFQLAYQACQTANECVQSHVNSTIANPPPINAPRIDQLQYNAAQGAALAQQHLAQVGEILQQNATQNPQFRDAMNQLANVLGPLNLNNQSSTMFPRAPASTPANIASPARNTDPTTTPAEPHQEGEVDRWDTEMCDTENERVENIDTTLMAEKPAEVEEHSQVVPESDTRSETFSVMNESTYTSVEADDSASNVAPNDNQQSVMDESTHTAIAPSSNVSSHAPAHCSQEMLDSLMAYTQNPNIEVFWDVPAEREQSSDIPSSRMSIFSDVEVISVRDDEPHDEIGDEADILNPPQPRVESDGQVIMDGGDGWMVLSQGSYEDMCRRYESARKISDVSSSAKASDVAQPTIIFQDTEVPKEKAPERIVIDIPNPFAAFAPQQPQQQPIAPEQEEPATPTPPEMPKAVVSPSPPVVYPTLGQIIAPEAPIPAPRTTSTEAIPLPPPRQGSSTTPSTAGPQMYPALNAAPTQAGETAAKCMAGTPYYDMSQYFAEFRHTRNCLIEHPSKLLFRFWFFQK